MKEVQEYLRLLWTGEGVREQAQRILIVYKDSIAPSIQPSAPKLREPIANPAMRDVE